MTVEINFWVLLFLVYGLFLCLLALFFRGATKKTPEEEKEDMRHEAHCLYCLYCNRAIDKEKWFGKAEPYKKP